MKKIVILGPESTGKSTLCTQLAAHYNTLWCPEYAREFLLQVKQPYTYEDLLHIAKSQLALEDEYTTRVEREWAIDNRQPAIGNEQSLHASHHSSLITHHSPYLFIDTDMNVMKIWCEVVFSNCHTWILNQAAIRQYDLHLLCDVDLPWVKDELREYPDLEFRKKLFKMYKDLLVNSNGKWAIISGTNAERLQSAIKVIEDNR